MYVTTVFQKIRNAFTIVAFLFQLIPSIIIICNFVIPNISLSLSVNILIKYKL